MFSTVYFGLSDFRGRMVRRSSKQNSASCFGFVLFMSAIFFGDIISTIFGEIKLHVTYLTYKGDARRPVH